MNEDEWMDYEREIEAFDERDGDGALPIPWGLFALSLILGGVMGTGDRPMVQLSDKEVHAKHGFDKWSFRKPPER